ncbi:MAG: hypothetical protein R3B57_07470 [Phycisphaerales bacterium]
MILLASVASGPALLAGCASTTTGGDSPTRAETPQASSSGTHPTQLLLAADSSLTDSDANGFPDTFQVVTYLFPESDVSALPVWAEGTFEFTLTGPDGKPIERWVFDQEASRAARVRTSVGRAESFFLRFGEGRDRMAPTVAELRGRFVSQDGRVLTAAGATSVRVGARR